MQSSIPPYSPPLTRSRARKLKSTEEKENIEDSSNRKPEARSRLTGPATGSGTKNSSIPPLLTEKSKSAAVKIQLSRDEANMTGAPKGPIFQVDVKDTASLIALDDPEQQLQALTSRLTEAALAESNKNWADAHEVIDTMRRLVVHHRALVDDPNTIALFVPYILETASGLRSSNIRNAILCLNEIFKHIALPPLAGVPPPMPPPPLSPLHPALVSIMGLLINRTTSDKKFITDIVHEALGVAVENIPHPISTALYLAQMVTGDKRQASSATNATSTTAALISSSTGAGGSRMTAAKASKPGKGGEGAALAVAGKFGGKLHPEAEGSCLQYVAKALAIALKGCTAENNADTSASKDANASSSTDAQTAAAKKAAPDLPYPSPLFDRKRPQPQPQPQAVLALQDGSEGAKLISAFLQMGEGLTADAATPADGGEQEEAGAGTGAGTVPPVNGCGSTTNPNPNPNPIPGADEEGGVGVRADSHSDVSASASASASSLYFASVLRAVVPVLVSGLSSRSPRGRAAGRSSMKYFLANIFNKHAANNNNTSANKPLPSGSGGGSSASGSSASSGLTPGDALMYRCLCPLVGEAEAKAAVAVAVTAITKVKGGGTTSDASHSSAGARAGAGAGAGVGGIKRANPKAASSSSSSSSFLSRGGGGGGGGGVSKGLPSSLSARSKFAKYKRNLGTAGTAAASGGGGGSTGGFITGGGKGFEAMDLVVKGGDTSRAKGGSGGAPAAASGGLESGSVSSTGTNVSAFSEQSFATAATDTTTTTSTTAAKGASSSSSSSAANTTPTPTSSSAGGGPARGGVRESDLIVAKCIGSLSLHTNTSTNGSSLESDNILSGGHGVGPGPLSLSVPASGAEIGIEVGGGLTLTSPVVSPAYKRSRLFDDDVSKNDVSSSSNEDRAIAELQAGDGGGGNGDTAKKEV